MSRAFKAILRREMSSIIHSPIVYVVAVCFLALFGFSVWWTANLMVKGVAGAGTGSTVLHDLFAGFFFWLANLIVVPVITMRVFSEEKRSGTLESLMTTPVSELEVVMAKFTATLLFYACLWLPTLGYGYILQSLGVDLAVLDFGALAGAYIGLLFVGASFVAMGLCCSAVSANQMVSAILCFSLLSGYFMLGLLPYASKVAWIKELSTYFSPILHMLDFSRGAIDSRGVVIFLSATTVFLFTTVQLLSVRRWK